MAVIEAPQRAEDRADARTRIHRVPTLVATLLALLMLVGVGVSAPVAANGGGSPADRVIAAAMSHLGARYVWGSTGPNTFDCSGLVYRAFSEAHLAKHIGGFNTAHGYYYSFRARGRTSRTNGQPGDIVVYNHGGHVGIYLGHGKVISALLSGVKIHPLNGINIRFTTFIHLFSYKEAGTRITVRPGLPAQAPDRERLLPETDPAAQARLSDSYSTGIALDYRLHPSRAPR